MSTLTKKEPQAPAETGRRIEYFTPRVNLYQDGEGYTLEVEMPGVAKEGVEVTVEDGKLVILGHRKSLAEAGRAIHREGREGVYRRVFDLDPSIDAGKVNARIEQGLLTLRLQKAEAVKPRKITVG